MDLFRTHSPHTLHRCLRSIISQTTDLRRVVLISMRKVRYDGECENANPDQYCQLEFFAFSGSLVGKHEKYNGATVEEKRERGY
jgi:hypothetical protein